SSLCGVAGFFLSNGYMPTIESKNLSVEGSAARYMNNSFSETVSIINSATEVALRIEGRLMLNGEDITDAILDLVSKYNENNIV
ncbi:hypothetical protein ACTVFF_22770, partial [Escherichia coli]|uniref:hypothetical protein n=1 Tax=Escherichia coli TaxID=562 RepID=UPI003FA604E9